jgi:DNA repair exonuclease SbcCD ATPase subunit
LGFELEETDDLIKNNSINENSSLKRDPHYADKTLAVSIDRACLSKEGQLNWNNNQNQLRILAKLKKISLEKDEIKNLYEELKKKERHFHMTNNSAQDAFRRLKISHHDSIRMNEEIENLKEIKISLDAKVNIYTNEIYTQENLNKNLIKENTLLLNENDKLKNKFVEVEEDIKKVQRLDKYIKKHSTASSSKKINNNINNNNKNNNKNVKLNNNAISEDDNNNGLDPQLFSYKYFPKDSNKDKKEGIEQTLFVLHEKLIKLNPSILPVFNKLVGDIQNERETIISSSSYRQPPMPCSSPPTHPFRSTSPKYSNNRNNKTTSFQTNLVYGGNIRKSM